MQNSSPAQDCSPAKETAQKCQKYPLSPAMRDFVHQSESFSSASTETQSIESQRHAYQRMTTYFARSRPNGIAVNDGQINGVATRSYQTQYNNTEPHQVAEQVTGTAQRILFAHGGGWYLGGLDSHDSFCAQLAKDTNMTVIATDYRLAPEAPYPAGLDDLSQVYLALLEQDPTPIILMGDSAGGNLVAALALRCASRSWPKALGQVLIYPALAAPETLASHKALADAPLLDSASMAFCWRNYIFPKTDTREPEVYPLQAISMDGLPTTALIAAEMDPLVDDSKCYHQKLKDAGIQTSLTIISGLVHGSLHGIGRSDEANQLYTAICDELKQLAN